MLKELHKREPTTPRVVYLCPLDLGGLIGVGQTASGQKHLLQHRQNALKCPW
jgi:hypothetical protein